MTVRMSRRSEERTESSTVSQCQETMAQLSEDRSKRAGILDDSPSPISFLKLENRLRLPSTLWCERYVYRGVRGQ